MSRKAKDNAMRTLMLVCAAFTCLVLLGLIGYLLYRGVPNLSWELVSTATSYLRGTVGILPNLLNTVYLIFVTMVIAIPLGVGAAVYLTEYSANHRVVRIVSFAVETLTGIPSIIGGKRISPRSAFDMCQTKRRALCVKLNAGHTFRGTAFSLAIYNRFCNFSLSPVHLTSVQNPI